MEKYGDHFNIDVLVAETNCTSVIGVYSVVIDHFFPSIGYANTVILISTQVYMEKIWRSFLHWCSCSFDQLYQYHRSLYCCN